MSGRERTMLARVGLLFLLHFVSGQNQSSLRLVHLVYRHGDRSPTETFPTDKYQEDNWPQGWGQLTQLGMMQHYHVGQYLRDRYILSTPFLSEKYVKDEVYVRSTDKDRTLMSAYCNLAGLYPPNGTQEWSKQIKWQPIPVHTRPYWDDPMLKMGVECPRYTALWRGAASSKEIKEYEETHQEFMAEVKKKAGLSSNFTMFNVSYSVPGALMCERSHNLTSNIFSNEDFVKLWKLKELEFKVYYYTPEMIKIRAGLFMNELTNHTKEYANRVSKQEIYDGKRMYLYSAHDTTLAAFLSGLGLWDYHIPGYASVLFFELHELQPQQFFMKILFKNDSVTNQTSPPLGLTLTGCTEYCPLDKFLEIIKPVVFDGTLADWHHMCNGGSADNKRSHSGATVAIAVSVILIIVLVVIGGLVCYKRKASGGIRYHAANFSAAQA